tara:strand:- start:270 stop:476 length:207 start_codon:yes stop_codon:yes gene_type:complete
MKQINSGDLVYIPSQVCLFKKDASETVEDYLLLEKPQNLLITAVNKDTYEVVLNSKHWLVNKNEVYEI